MNVFLPFLLLCLIHILILVFSPNVFLINVITKCIPILYLILVFIGWQKKNQRSGSLLFLLALVFSLGGDFLLALNGKLNNNFIFGLGSFLVAQIFYIFSFSKNANLQTSKAYPFYIAGAAIYLYLYPSLAKDLLLPVFLYMTALTTMGWRASARNASKESLQLSTIGAVSFLVSDGLIALTQFKNLGLPYPQIWIMVTYYAAQYFLVRGYIRK
jgi:uncharacterized membrane protein YhhN